MLFGIFVLLVLIGLVAALIYASDYFLNKKTKISRLIGAVIFLLLFIGIFQSYFFSSYPNPRTATVVDGKTVSEFNIEDSYTICEIDKWIKVDELGWIYFNKIDVSENNQLRLFYRRPGLIDNKIYKYNLSLTDSSDNVFEDHGGDINTALFYSSGSMDFVSEELIEMIDDNYIINIAGTAYDLQ